MKFLPALIACVLLSFAPEAAFAQPTAQSGYRGPDLAAQRTAIERLAPLVGVWRGEARVAFPHAVTVHQTERVERDLDGLVLVVRGTGYADASHSGAPVFRALAVISYDDSRGRYEFRAYNEGRTVTADAQFLDDGSLRWSMSPPGVQIRYTISFDANTWREVGEMSRDAGVTWTPTVEMNLTRAP